MIKVDFMTLYVRELNSNVWHWNRFCSHYPKTEKAKIRKTKPWKGIFCPECIRLSKNPYMCSYALKKRTDEIHRLEV